MIDRRKFLIGSGIGMVGTTLAPYIAQAGTSGNAPERAPDLGNAPMATEPSPLKPGTGNAADFDPTVAQLITKPGYKIGTHFSLQTMDFEQSFMHPHSILEPGITYALLPWIHANRPGRFVGHAFGNTVVCTNEGALALNNSALDLVVI